MRTSKRAKRAFTWAITLALVVSLFGIFPPRIHAEAPNFLGAVGAPDPSATPITTAQELAAINNNLSGNYYLANDIDLAGYGNWTPIGDDTAHPFTGSFDGQGHLVKNMTVTVAHDPKPNDASVPLHGYAGLFGHTKNAELKNIGVVGAKINAAGQFYTGGVVGLYTTDKPLYNCFFTGEINVQLRIMNAHNYVGGVVGRIINTTEGASTATNEMTDCYNEGNITVSYASGSSGTSHLHVGGVVGNGDFLVANHCLNAGSVFVNLDSNIDADNSMSGTKQVLVGGFVGDATFRLELSDCHSSGNVTVSANGQCNLRVGGLAGQTQRSVQIDNCYNTGNMRANVNAGTYAYINDRVARVGGLFGAMENDPNFTPYERDVAITNSHNTGDVTAIMVGAGKNSYYSRALTGGIAGYACTIYAQNTYNTGNIYCTLPISAGVSLDSAKYNTYSAAGGFYGEVEYAHTPSIIVDCYNLGNVEARSREAAFAYAGGFVGNLNNAVKASNLDISNSYSVAALTASSHNGVSSTSDPMGEFTRMGGLLGYGKVDSYKFSNSYYLKFNNGQAVGDRYGDSSFPNVKALTADQLRDQSSFVGFDFQNVWKMPANGGYPVIAIRTGGEVDPPEEEKEGDPASGPEGEPSPAPNLDSASDWARDEITSAVNKGFVPADIQDRYTDVITRAEFCRMAIGFVEYVTGYDIDVFLANRGLSLRTDAFSDTSDTDILAAYALGITTGTVAPTQTTPGTFEPNGSFDREMAATMLMRVGKVLGMETGNIQPAGFVDMITASSWAHDGINFCYASGIMNGTSTSPLRFSPKETYTREQSILTFDRVG